MGYGVDDYTQGFKLKEPEAGNGQQSNPESYWYTGYSGNKRPGYSSGGQQTGGVYFGQQPGSPGYNATAGAFQLQNQDYDKGLAALRAGQFLPPGAGNAAMEMFTNPQGYSPEAMQGIMANLADTEAGSRENALRQLENQAAARGFRNSVGVMDAGARTRARSAANLLKLQNAVKFENERAKIQQQGIGAGVVGSLTSAEAAMLRALASGYFNRPRDVVPGISPGPDGAAPGGGHTWQYLNERGEIIPRPQWSQYDWEQARRERQMYELMGG